MSWVPKKSCWNSRWGEHPQKEKTYTATTLRVGVIDWWLLRQRFTAWVWALEERPWSFPSSQLLRYFTHGRQRRSRSLGQGVKLALLFFRVRPFSMGGLGFEAFYYSLNRVWPR